MQSRLKDLQLYPSGKAISKKKLQGTRSPTSTMHNMAYWDTYKVVFSVTCEVTVEEGDEAKALSRARSRIASEIYEGLGPKVAEIRGLIERDYYIDDDDPIMTGLDKLLERVSTV